MDADKAKELLQSDRLRTQQLLKEITATGQDAFQRQRAWGHVRFSRAAR